MAAPFIYETARVPSTPETPIGQPLGLTVDTSIRETMDPDTFTHAYMRCPDAVTGTGNDNRIQVHVTNAIEPGSTTTTYDWAFTSAGSGVATPQNAAGTTLTAGNADAALDLDQQASIYLSFDAADTYTIACNLESSAANPVDRNLTNDCVVSA